MQTDVLSDVLRAVRLTGAVYFDFEMSAPWVAEAPPSREIAGIVMPGAQRVIEYHVIARGACWGHVVGAEPMRLREGDLIVFPQGDAHLLSSAPGMRATPDIAMFARPATPRPLMYELGGGGDRASSGWLSTLLNIAVGESGTARAGSENILSRLSELMFVDRGKPGPAGRAVAIGRRRVTAAGWES